ncbi:ion transporter [Sorangium sp. So ce1151]|uniref:ion transporter n=1 Tax=Sorangium sp. So ce1151 TaxID=3133332 RepID=UPI003F60DF3F
MAPWRVRMHDIIFEAETFGGRLFDIVLSWLILISVGAVMLESVAAINARIGPVLRGVEWGITVLFTIEYVLRLACVRRPFGYAVSFFGIVDLLSLVPTYLSLAVAGTQALLVIRVIRLLRVFRLFRLARLVGEAEVLFVALMSSRAKITVFLGTVLTLVIIFGTSLYVVEGPASGFTSIPRSIYWAIVTLTTVGYGDIAPRTALGQAIAAAVMILGYAIIAVPTGIVSVELVEAARAARVQRVTCPSCAAAEHESDARYCRFCGARLRDASGDDRG